MNKKLKTILSLSLTSAVLVGGVSSIAAIYLSASANNVYTSPDINRTPTYVTRQCYLDSKISDPIQSDPQISPIVSNEYNVSQSFVDVNRKLSNLQDNTNLSFYRIGDDNSTIEAIDISGNLTAENFEKDIFSTIKTSHLNNQEIDIILSSKNISYVDNKLSFEYKLDIKKGEDPISFAFNNISFYIPKGTEFNITFKVDNQPVNVSLQKNNMYWSVDNVDVLINDESINKLKANMTFNSFSKSYSVPYLFTNVSSDDDYKQITDISKEATINEELLQKQIYDHIQKNKSIAFDVIDLLDVVLKELGTNPTLTNFLKNISSDLANFLVKLELLPEGSQNLIIEALSNDKTLKDIIKDNDSAIADIVISFLPEEFSSIVNKDVLVSWAIPGLLNKDPVFSKLIDELVPSEFVPLVNSVLKLLLDDNAKPLDLIQTLINSTEFNDLVTSNEFIAKYQSLIDLLKVFINNKDQSVLKTVADNKNAIVDILKTLLGNSSSSYDKIFNMLITNNKNLTEGNIQNLITKTLSPLVTFIADENNYNVVEDGEDVSKWTLPLTVDNNNKTFSFKYNFDVVFNKDFTLNLRGVYDIAPWSVRAAWELFFIRDWTIKSGDKFDSLFSADNQQLYFSPSQQNGQYYLGYVAPFNYNFWLNMPGFYQSGASQYQRYFTAGADGLGYRFYKSLLETLLMPDYDFVETASYVDDSQVITNYSNSLYMYDIFYTYNSNYDATKASSYLSTNNVNKVTLKFKKDTWVFGNEYSDFYGKKATITEDNKKLLLQDLFPQYDSWMSLPSELQPYINVTPTNNGVISVLGSLNINFPLKIVNVSITFPYEVYNKDTGSFSSSFSQTLIL